MYYVLYCTALCIVSYSTVLYSVRFSTFTQQHDMTPTPSNILHYFLFRLLMPRYSTSQRQRGSDRRGLLRCYCVARHRRYVRDLKGVHSPQTLYSIVLRCAVLLYTASYSIVQCYSKLCCVVLCSIGLYRIALSCWIIFCCATMQCTVLYCTVLYCTVLYSLYCNLAH